MKVYTIDSLDDELQIQRAINTVIEDQSINEDKIVNVQTIKQNSVGEVEVWIFVRN
jgi:hypothetical protein